GDPAAVGGQPLHDADPDHGPGGRLRALRLRRALALEAPSSRNEPWHPLPGLVSFAGSLLPLAVRHRPAGGFLRRMSASSARTRSATAASTCGVGAASEPSTMP